MKICIPACIIPDETIVTKKNGAVTYTLLRKIKVYDKVNGNKDIECAPGTVMLLDNRGNVNVYPEYTKFNCEINPKRAELLIQDFIHCNDDNLKLLVQIIGEKTAKNMCNESLFAGFFAHGA